MKEKSCISSRKDQNLNLIWMWEEVVDWRALYEKTNLAFELEVKVGVLAQLTVRPRLPACDRLHLPDGICGFVTRSGMILAVHGGRYRMEQGTRYWKTSLAPPQFSAYVLPNRDSPPALTITREQPTGMVRICLRTANTSCSWS